MCFFNKIILFFLSIILFAPISFAEIAEDSELIVSLKVNYAETDIFPTIVKNTAGNWLIPFEDIKDFNVQEQYLQAASVNFHDIEYVNLDLLQGIKYNLNQEVLDLEIIFPSKEMQAQSFNATNVPAQNIDNKLISGVFFNYDITLTQSSNSNYLAGVEEIDYFTESGVYTSNFLLQTEAINSNFSKIKNNNNNHSKFTRLETNWTYENVENMTNWRAGDSITKPASWSNSSRFAGIQYATNFAYMSFNLNLDANKSVSLTDSYQNNYHVRQLGFASPISSNIGWGYSANLIKGKNTNYNVQINRNGEINDVGAYLSKNDAETTTQLNIKGGVVSLDKNYYMTRPITGGLALVKVSDLKDIGVYNNNQLIGYTNDQGKVLIPNVIPYVPSEIRLDDEKLPLNTEFSDIALSVAPKTKSAVYLDFDVKIIRSIEMTIFDSNKHFVPFDSTVTIEGVDEELFVGYDGKVYISDVKNLEVLNGSICNENVENSKCCHFSVPINKDLNDPIIDLGDVVCE